MKKLSVDRARKRIRRAVKRIRNYDLRGIEIRLGIIVSLIVGGVVVTDIFDWRIGLAFWIPAFGFFVSCIRSMLMRETEIGNCGSSLRRNGVEFHKEGLWSIDVVYDIKSRKVPMQIANTTLFIGMKTISDTHFMDDFYVKSNVEQKHMVFTMDRENRSKFATEEELSKALCKLMVRAGGELIESEEFPFELQLP